MGLGANLIFRCLGPEFAVTLWAFECAMIYFVVLEGCVRTRSGLVR